MKIILICLLSNINNIFGLNSPHKTRLLAQNNYKLVPYFSKSYCKKYNLHYSQEFQSYLFWSYKSYFQLFLCYQFLYKKILMLVTSLVP